MAESLVDNLIDKLKNNKWLVPIIVLAIILFALFQFISPLTELLYSKRYRNYSSNLDLTIFLPPDNFYIDGVEMDFDKLESVYVDCDTCKIENLAK